LQPSGGNVLINTTTDAGFRLDVNGTARVQQFGIGSAAINSNLSVVRNIVGGWVGSATFGANIFSSGTVQSDVTTSAHYNVTRPSTQATTFTLSNLSSYTASNVTIGLGSTVTNLYGFTVESTHIGGTNNYGFASFISVGTNRWNLFMGGTAANHLAGKLLIGSTTDVPSASVAITSTTEGFLPPRMTAAQRTAIASPAEGLIVYQTNSVIGLYIYANATWRTLGMI
jgi:hypothetical protein